MIPIKTKTQWLKNLKLIFSFCALTVTINLLFFTHDATRQVPYDAVEQQVVCYVTATGKKYHGGDCQYLWNSKIQTTIKQAVEEGYTACSRCRVDYNYTNGVIVTKYKSEIFKTHNYFASGTITILIFAFIKLRHKMEQIKEEKQKYTTLFSQKTILELSQAPDNVIFNNNQECILENGTENKYGGYTVYISKSGYCYHLKKGCSQATYEKHLFDVIASKYHPCSKCIKDAYPYKTIPDWYIEVQRLIEIKNKYKI